MILEEKIKKELKGNFKKEEKEKSFWDKFILNLEGEKKEDIALSVVNDSKLRKIYWIELALSAIIATFGLLNNSVAVIIGAMLIAPLFRPIQSLSFGIITGQHKIAVKSLKNIIYSVFLAIFLSMFFSALIPISYETSEMISRVNPNILDLFIAVFSAIIAFLSIMFKKELSMSIAGVAMAASLLPPLAVVGIELNMANYAAAWGSFLLFLTNIVAIIFTGIWLFFFYGFRPHQEDDKKVFRKNILILSSIIIIISIPLISSLLKINTQIFEKKRIQAELKEIFKNGDNGDIKLYNIDIIEGIGEREKVFLGLKIPEGKDFYKESQQLIRGKISQILNRDVDLEIEILRTANITAPSKEPEFNQKIRYILENEVSDISLLDLTLEKNGIDSYEVKIIFSLLEDNNFTNIFKDELENIIKKELEELELKFIWIPLEQGSFRGVTIKDPMKEMAKLINLEINNYLTNDLENNIDYNISNLIWKVKDSVELNNENINLINVDEIYLLLDLYIDSEIEELNSKNILLELNKIFMDAKIDLNLRIFSYQNQKVILNEEESENNNLDQIN